MICISTPLPSPVNHVSIKEALCTPVNSNAQWFTTSSITNYRQLQHWHTTHVYYQCPGPLQGFLLVLTLLEMHPLSPFALKLQACLSAFFCLAVCMSIRWFRHSEHLISLVGWHDVMYLSLSLSLSLSLHACDVRTATNQKESSGGKESFHS